MENLKAQIARKHYYFISKYGLEPDMLLLNKSDFVELKKEYNMLILPLKRRKKFRYMGMKIITTRNVKRGELTVFLSI